MMTNVRIEMKTMVRPASNNRRTMYVSTCFDPDLWPFLRYALK